jgi:alpha-D-ribose 1-methylphosphonate 5-triphosphate synthase subunit PhnI
VGLCDGLLNSEIFNTYLPIFETSDSSKLVVSTLDRSTRSWITWVVHNWTDQPFVISLISQEKVDFIISHVDNAYTSDFVRHNTIIDSASFATELNTLTRVDYEKSKRPDKGVRPG